MDEALLPSRPERGYCASTAHDDARARATRRAHPSSRIEDAISRKLEATRDACAKGAETQTDVAQGVTFATGDTGARGSFECEFASPSSIYRCSR